MITSMNQVTLLIAISVFFLFLIHLRTNPFNTAGLFVKNLYQSPKYLLHFLALISILMINKFELWLERQMVTPADFTPHIYRFEGDIVYWIQRLFEHEWLTFILGFFYIVIFTALLAVSIGIYTQTKQFHLYYAFIYAIIINYLLAIPFYLFVPVNEVWYHIPQKVQFLMLDFFPTFEQEYRPLSGLDNCLPSLHTSVSVTIALIALRSKLVLWRWTASICAVIIIFSIFYMGIHWVVDMFAGLLLGVFAATVSLRVVEGRLWFSKTGLPLFGQARDYNEKM
jgi:membrane-associated phospholipid phosphatase